MQECKAAAQSLQRVRHHHYCADRLCFTILSIPFTNKTRIIDGGLRFIKAATLPSVCDTINPDGQQPTRAGLRPKNGA